MVKSTGWRRPIGCLKLQVIFHKKTTNYRTLLQKITCKDKACYGSSPPYSKSSGLVSEGLRVVNWCSDAPIEVRITNWGRDTPIGLGWGKDTKIVVGMPQLG